MSALRREIERVGRALLRFLEQFLVAGRARLGRRGDQILGGRRRSGAIRRGRQRLAFGGLDLVRRTAGRERQREKHAEPDPHRLSPSRTARAAAIASRTRAGAVPPKLVRLATDASTERT